MTLKLKRVTAPTDPPVTLVQAKAHVRQDSDADDTLLTDLITRATRWCEEEAELSFMAQSWRLSLDAFPADPIQLPRPPVAEVVSVEYYDTDGVLQTLADTEYQVDTDAEPALLTTAPTKTWPSTQSDRLGAVRISYTAGVDDAANLDERAGQAVLLLVGHWYANREAVVTGTIATEVQTALRALLGQMWVGVL